MNLLKSGLILLIVALAVTACTSSKELTRNSLYFRDISDSLLTQAPLEYEPVFQKGDILSIAVITPNESTARLFNQQPAGQARSSAEGQSTPGAAEGYLIDESGNITLPYVGAIPAAGSTRTTLRDAISLKLRQYVDSPIVSIRLLNYRVTVLGEVNKPGTFSIPSERVTVLDAIGLAGDLTVYGQRKNIRVIRTSEGTRQTGTLDLNKGDIFSSPFFYLRQNDIVYIEMNERKIPNTDQASLRNVSIALGIISALGVVISTINVLR